MSAIDSMRQVGARAVIARLLILGGCALLSGESVSAPAWGCKAARVVEGKTVSGCIQVAGEKRAYRVHVPKGIVQRGERVPVLVGFHGGGGKPRQFESYSRLSEFSEGGRSFIVVYPAGVDKHWNDGRGNVNAGVDDVQFFERLLDHLQQDLELPVDPGRVYLAGMSNGGLMALRLACEKPDRVAGAAVVAASMTSSMAARCRSGAAPVNMVFIFGDRDTAFLGNGKLVSPVKPSQQRGSHIGIDETVKLWAGRNGCAGSPSETRIDRVMDDGTRVVKKSYAGCEKPLSYYRVEGGGHRWPDQQAGNGRLMVKVLNLGFASHDIDTGRVIVDAFIGADTAMGH